MYECFDAILKKILVRKTEEIYLSLYFKILFIYLFIFYIELSNGQRMWNFTPFVAKIKYKRHAVSVCMLIRFQLNQSDHLFSYNQSKCQKISLAKFFRLCSLFSYFCFVLFYHCFILSLEFLLLFVLWKSLTLRDK